MSDRRNEFFSSLFDKQRMRRRYPSQDSALSAYLQEIGVIPLLTAEQEADLLARAAHGDLNAKQRLVEANLRLVLLIAARFQGRGLAMLDLIQEGNIGLLEAVERFDREKTARFSTYAKYWILNAVNRAVTGRGKMLSTTFRTEEHIQKIREIVSLFLHQDIEPTPERIAGRVGLSTEQVVELLDLMREPLSLYRTEGENDALIDVLVAPPLLLSNESGIVSPSLLADVRQMISTVLTPKERVVIEHRLGLTEDGIVYGYREIAATCFQRTGPRADEAVRQLEKSAQMKLREAFEEKKNENSTL